MVQPPVKGHLGPPEAGESCLSAFGGRGVLRMPRFQVLPCRTQREYVFIILSYIVCGNVTAAPGTSHRAERKCAALLWGRNQGTVPGPPTDPPSAPRRGEGTGVISSPDRAGKLRKWANHDFIRDLRGCVSRFRNVGQSESPSCRFRPWSVTNPPWLWESHLPSVSLLPHLLDGDDNTLHAHTLPVGVRIYLGRHSGHCPVCGRHSANDSGINFSESLYSTEV